jgi:dephospho-CoA kinase
MRAPIIAVTGAIASGKTLVATVLAGGQGALIDCDALAHRAYEDDKFVERLVGWFGASILTPSGKVSRVRLGRIVFADEKNLTTLNGLVKPYVRRIISERVRREREEARYIVLDAVLFFQYKFRFKVELVVLTEASVKTRLSRVMRRDGLSRKEALLRIERQKPLVGSWKRADVTIRTDQAEEKVIAAATKIRDRFIAQYL